MAKTLAYAAVWLILLGYVVNGVAQQASSSIPASAVAPVLKIGSGDLLEVTMFDDPELSGHFRVDAKGDIDVPLVGHVHVQGLTAEEAGTLIAKRYVEADILKPAGSHVTVFISEYATQGITVSGQVKLPGVYPALGVRMLNDVIAAAGGTTLLAASRVVITHRDDPNAPITVNYNPEALSPNVPPTQVFPGDTILVPRAGIVYVLGDVNHSGGFELDGRNVLTVERAMALAGGAGRAPSLRHVQLVRTLQDGRKEAISIAMDQIYKGKAPDIAMQDGDVLYVPTSTGKLAAQQAVQSALGIGTSITIYKTAYH